MDYQDKDSVDSNAVENMVETLATMFGDLLTKDLIFAVVESCGHDMNLAAEAIVNITSDVSNATAEQATNSTNTSEVITGPENRDVKPENIDRPTLKGNITSTMQTENQPIISYAGASRSTGAVPKPNNPRRFLNETSLWTEQLRQIITYHNQGSRILILMRGIPGSGKTYLAKSIIEITIGNSVSELKNHIFSTDDYFMIRGVYQFDRTRLEEAHKWNQRRVKEVLKQGLSPVIVDNTNIEMWEMEPYTREGVRNGYIVEVIEPNTPWAKKAYQLFKRNNHDVPLATIRRYLDKYVDGYTGAMLIQQFGLSYPADLIPPVMRNIPAVKKLQCVSSKIDVSSETNISSSNELSNVPRSQTNEVISTLPNELQTEYMKADSTETPQTTLLTMTEDQNSVLQLTHNEQNTMKGNQEEIERQKKYLELETQLKEIEKVEQEWENGETWGEDIQGTISSSNEVSTSINPKPPRNILESSSTDSLMESVKKCEDWSDICKFLPPLTDDKTFTFNNVAHIPVETTSSSTCMEIGDTDWQSPDRPLKVITTTPRDINLFHTPSPLEKIPETLMLHKGTMTNELIITEPYRCKNEEQHFIAFRKFFKNVPKAALRDVFDKCCGDVNWAVEIILDGIANNQLQTVEGDDISDTEEENQEQCNCLAAYNIVPDATNVIPVSSQNTADNLVDSTILTQKKAKTTPSDNSVQLKRQIEKNFVISDEHYSEHCLKIRKMRRGEITQNDEDLFQSSPLEMQDKLMTQDNSASGPSQVINTSCLNADSDDEESNASSIEECERTVNFNFGKEFLTHLDLCYGRSGITYPDFVKPRFNIPVSLLNEINAFWIESLMYQLDKEDNQKSVMLREDEEFARQLEYKEAELASQGKEPEVLDFKEIMDMEYALSLYNKDVGEWRNNEPQDLAAKLSRDKLYNLFPDTSPDTLSELLMAHDNNFQTTVEVLLMSTGRQHILEEKNGLNKFMMQKEMERQNKLLAEERKTLSEVEWPLLPKDEKLEMSTVQKYRDDAAMYLDKRNSYYQKAQEYIRRGLTQAATYYSQIASFHKMKFEHANSMAAATLMQIHAANCQNNAVIDLHYLRVAEAKESLDLFLDTHIQKLRETQHRGVRYHTLHFITGRGAHSKAGVPRVKPAIKKRLRERGLTFGQRNPGLLTANVCADDKLSYQVQ